MSESESIYLARDSTGWQCSAGSFIWSQLSSFMCLGSAVGQWVALLSGCWLAVDQSRMDLAGTAVLCSTWCLILQQASLGLFTWQKQASRRKKKYTGLWRASLRNRTPSLWPLLAKASNETSPDSRGGAGDPIFWWEKQYITLQKMCVQEVTHWSPIPVL